MHNPSSAHGLLRHASNFTSRCPNRFPQGGPLSALRLRVVLSAAMLSAPLATACNQDTVSATLPVEGTPSAGPLAGNGTSPMVGMGDQTPRAADDGLWLEVTTDEYVISPGEERNVCYVQTLPSAINVDRFEYESRPGIHHLLFSRLTKPEEEGSFECNVLFKPTWMVLFGTGTTGQQLEFPAGSAQVLSEGTQVLVQLHLLNASDQDLPVSATVRMRHSEEPDPNPISMFTFGSDDINIPAGGEANTVGECKVPGDLHIAAMLPHMHYLGRSLTLELGDPSRPTAPMQEFYRRDPWNFDNQYIDRMDALIPKGTPARVTCSFRNTTAQPVTFGDSSHDEMCFLVTYIVGERIGSCTTITDPMRLQKLFEN